MHTSMTVTFRGQKRIVEIPRTGVINVLRVGCDMPYCSASMTYFLFSFMIIFIYLKNGVKENITTNVKLDNVTVIYVC